MRMCTHIFVYSVNRYMCAHMLYSYQHQTKGAMLYEENYKNEKSRMRYS